MKTESFQILKEFPDQQDMVITSNGRPVSILLSVTEDNLKQILSSFCQARAIQSVNTIQYDSAEKGADNISMNEINNEIKEVRSKRKT